VNKANIIVDKTIDIYYISYMYGNAPSRPLFQFCCPKSQLIQSLKCVCVYHRFKTKLI